MDSARDLSLHDEMKQKGQFIHIVGALIQNGADPTMKQNTYLTIADPPKNRNKNSCVNYTATEN